MSAENNPRLRQLAIDLKRANAMFARGESLQVVLIDVWFAGYGCALDILAGPSKPPRKRMKKEKRK